jgi:hypothetical protein
MTARGWQSALRQENAIESSSSAEAGRGQTKRGPSKESAGFTQFLPQGGRARGQDLADTINWAFSNGTSGKN